MALLGLMNALLPNHLTLKGSHAIRHRLPSAPAHDREGIGQYF